MEPHEIFPSALPTDPAPLRAIVTVYCGGGGAPNVAVTLWLDPRVTVQPPVPLQAPLQPVNADPDAGVAARLTVVPAA